MGRPQKLGELIREQRLALGLSLGQLATKVGRTAASIRKWERGEDFPPWDERDKLAAVLSITVPDIEALHPGPDAEQATDVQVKDQQVAESQEQSAELPVIAKEAESPPLEGAAEELQDSDTRDDSSSGNAGGAVDEPSTPSADDPPERATTGEPTQPVPVALHDDSTLPTPKGVAAEPADDPKSPPTVPLAPAPAPVGAVEEFPQQTRMRPVAVSTPGPDVTDAPTQAIPVAASVSVPVAAAVMRQGPAAAPYQVAQATPTPSALDLLRKPFDLLFDPESRILYWIRTLLTVVVLAVFAYFVVKVGGQLLDRISEVFDTFESEPFEGENLESLAKAVLRI